MKKFFILIVLCLPILINAQNTFKVDIVNTNSACNLLTYKLNINLDSVKYNKFAWVFNDKDTIISTELSQIYTFDSKNLSYFKVLVFAVDTLNDKYEEYWDYLNLNDFKPYFYNSQDTICPKDLLSISVENNHFINSSYWTVDDQKVNQKTDFLHDNRFYFENEGSHSIKLYYIQKGCSDYDYLEKTIYVSKNLVPNFDLYPNKTDLCPNDQISFFLNLENTSKYVVDFGDGNTDIGKSRFINIQHKYQNKGKFDLKIDVTNSCGNTKTISKTITTDKPKTYFGSDEITFNTDTVSVCANTETTEQIYNHSYLYDNFTSLKSIKWKLNGKELNNDNKSNIKLVYKEKVNYLEIKITNNCDIDTILKKVVYVDEIKHYTGNNIEFGNITICINEPIKIANIISDNYQNEIYDYNNTIVDKSKEFIFNTPGDYTFHLKYTDECKNDTLFPLTVSVHDKLPFGTLLSEVGEICPGETKELKLLYFGNKGNHFKNIIWNIPGEKNELYTNLNYIQFKKNQPGTYDVKLQLFNHCGQDTILTTKINVSNNVKLNSSYFINEIDTNICKGKELSFLNTNYFNLESLSNVFKTIKFDFGDGTSGINSKHIFNSNGIYNTKVYFENYCGFDTTINYKIHVGDSEDELEGLFKLSCKKTICPNDILKINIDEVKDYNELSYFEGNIKYIRWEFGDGTSLITLDSYTNYLDVMHAYSNIGKYTIKAILYDYCNDSTIISKEIEVTNSAFVTYNNYFEYFDDELCPNEKGVFGHDIVYKNCTWDFGDGSKGFGNIVTHAYTNPGIYTIENKIINGCGQDTIIRKKINVSSYSNPSDLIDLINKSTCVGDYNYLFVTLKEKDTISISCKNEKLEEQQIELKFPFLPTKSYIYAFKFNSPGEKQLDVLLKNECGQSDSLSEILTISDQNNYQENELFILNTLFNNLVSLEDSIYLLVPKGKKFIWDMGDGVNFTTDVGLISYKYQTPGLKQIKVKVITGCGDTTEYYNRFQIFDDSYLKNLATTEKINPIELNLKLYPNPANEEITFDLPEIKDRKIQIIDLLGNIIYTNNKADNQITLNVSHFSEGMYIVNVFNNEFKTNAKFIVTH